MLIYFFMCFTMNKSNHNSLYKSSAIFCNCSSNPRCCCCASLSDFVRDNAACLSCGFFEGFIRMSTTR